MEFIVLPTTYLLGVWLYGFMLRNVEPGSSRENTMFRFRCWFSVMKIGRGNPSLIKKNYYLRSGLLVPIVFGSKFIHEFYL